MQLTLPYPPSVNTYWRHVLIQGHPRVLISSQGREYRRKVILALTECDMMLGPLVVTIAVYPPDRMRRDVDNILKGLLDAMQHGGAYEDDSQIVELHVRKHAPDKPGRVEVEISVDDSGPQGTLFDRFEAKAF
jgi:Holliday junction resolvase RusA-like endonuclease